MTLPPSHPTGDYEDCSGFWFELQDATGKIIYGRRIHDPMPTHHEVYSHEGVASSRKVRRRIGSFDVLVW
jgi:hypothetical protein